MTLIVKTDPVCNCLIAVVLFLTFVKFDEVDKGHDSAKTKQHTSVVKGVFN